MTAQFWAHAALGCIFVDSHPPVVKEQDQAVPVFGDVFQSLPGW